MHVTDRTGRGEVYGGTPPRQANTLYAHDVSSNRKGVRATLQQIAGEAHATQRVQRRVAAGEPLSEQQLTPELPL